MGVQIRRSLLGEVKDERGLVGCWIEELPAYLEYLGAKVSPERLLVVEYACYHLHKKRICFVMRATGVLIFTFITLMLSHIHINIYSFLKTDHLYMYFSLK